MTRTEQRGQITWSNLRSDTPFLSSLLEDSRFYGWATQILGDETIGSYSRSTSFDGQVTGWHPDVRWREWEGLKFGFYLQSVTEATGALRLIPGSHDEPLYSDLDSINFGTAPGSGKDRTAVEVEEVPAFIATASPGDVVAFDNRTWHASYGGFKGRRLCTIGYFAAPKNDAQREAVKQYVGMEAGLRQTWPLMDRGPEWRANTERNSNSTEMDRSPGALWVLCHRRLSSLLGRGTAIPRGLEHQPTRDGLRPIFEGSTWGR